MSKLIKNVVTRLVGHTYNRSYIAILPDLLMGALSRPSVTFKWTQAADRMHLIHVEKKG